MTRQELDAALARLGLDVPETERDEIAAAAHLLERWRRGCARRRARCRGRAGACRRAFRRAERWSRIILTIAEAARLIEKKELSPVELVESRLDRIARLDGRLHSFIRVLADEARARRPRRRGRDRRRALPRAAARHPDRPQGHLRDRRGRRPPAIPRSCRTMCRRPTRFRSTKLRAGRRDRHGQARDPRIRAWRPELRPALAAGAQPVGHRRRFTGGSSSGTGASVAAGLVLGGTGSDTGGSIRGPAAYCGLAGIKPTYGLISRAGILPLAFSLDHAGPMAWTAEDCAIMLQAMAGHDPADPASANRADPRLPRRAAGRRQGAAHRPHPPFLRARQRGQRRDPRRDRRRRRKTFEEPRLRGARDDAVAARRMGGLRRDDHAGRGLRDPRGQSAHALHRLRRDLPRPHGAGRADHRRRLRAGAAPPPRTGRRTRPGDGRSRSGDDRRGAERGAADRRGAANSRSWNGRA